MSARLKQGVWLTEVRGAWRCQPCLMAINLTGSPVVDCTIVGCGDASDRPPMTGEHLQTLARAMTTPAPKKEKR